MAATRFLYHWVVIVYRSLVTIIGIPGNSIILYVYWNKGFLGSAQVFIQFLALTDLYACILFPLELHYWLHEYDYRNDLLCRLFFTLLSIGFYMSSCVTVAISIDRYLAVCKPINGRWSRRQAQTVCLVCVAIAVVVNIVLPFSSGLQVISYENSGIFNVTVCSQRESSFVGLGLFVTIPQYITFLVVFAVILAMYFRLWLTMKKRGKVGGLHGGTTSVKAVSDVADGSIADTIETYYNKAEDSHAVDVSGSTSGDHVKNCQEQGASTSLVKKSLLIKEPNYSDVGAKQESSGGLPVYVSHGDCNNRFEPKPDAAGRNNQLNQPNCDDINNEGSKLDGARTSGVPSTNGIPTSISENARKTSKTAGFRRKRNHGAGKMSRLTQMLLLSTAIFLVTWILTLVIFIMSSITRSVHRNSVWFAVISVVRLSGLINHAINPMLYSFMNPRFRNDCALLFKRLRSKIT
ncbi:uncharacterized protein [Apostichopus japonicus]|uniref:uncharacterized protein n=1 Tax=Stichopus japonicus TaxID=307972 RepID=UPI003AB57C53